MLKKKHHNKKTKNHTIIQKHNNLHITPTTTSPNSNITINKTINKQQIKFINKPIPKYHTSTKPFNKKILIQLLQIIQINTIKPIYIQKIKFIKTKHIIQPNTQYTNHKQKNLTISHEIHFKNLHHHHKIFDTKKTHSNLKYTNLTFLNTNNNILNQKIFKQSIKKLDTLKKTQTNNLNPTSLHLYNTKNITFINLQHTPNHFIPNTIITLHFDTTNSLLNTLLHHKNKIDTIIIHYTKNTKHHNIHKTFILQQINKSNKISLHHKTIKHITKLHKELKKNKLLLIKQILYTTIKHLLTNYIHFINIINQPFININHYN